MPQPKITGFFCKDLGSVVWSTGGCHEETSIATGKAVEVACTGYQNTVQSQACDDPLHLIISVIPAEFSPVPIEAVVLEITLNKGTLPEKKRAKEINSSIQVS